MDQLFASYAPFSSENKDDNKDDNKENKKCCKRPFTTCSIKTGITECRSCKKKFKEYSVLVYSCTDCQIQNVETNKVLNLLKNGSTNWTECEKCKKHVQYDRKHKIDFLNT